MPHNKLLSELEEWGETIVVALSKDKQRNKASRNAKYKAKRITELAEAWDNYNKKLIEIKLIIKPEEPCLAEAVTKYATAYKEYMDRLSAIQDDPQPDSEDDSTTDTSSTQSVRNYETNSG